MDGNRVALLADTQAALEADVVARAGQLTRGGWADRLQSNTYDYPPREVTGARLLFVPVTQHRGWVAWDAAARFAVIYPCSGVLAEPGHTPAPEALARLLGPGRRPSLPGSRRPRAPPSRWR